MTKNNIFYGWYIVGASLILIILDGLLLYSFGIFLPSLNDKFSLSEAGGSSIYALRSFVLAFSLAISGRLVDKYDPRIIDLVFNCPAITFCIARQWQIKSV